MVSLLLAMRVGGIETVGVVVLGARCWTSRMASHMSGSRRDSATASRISAAPRCGRPRPSRPAKPGNVRRNACPRATATATPAATAVDRRSYLSNLGAALRGALRDCHNTPQRVRITDPAVLSDFLPDLWLCDVDFAMKTATATRLELLAVTQAANYRKALALLGAIAAQVIAVLLLAWSVLAML
jgi:hypothetical protein